MSARVSERTEPGSSRWLSTLRARCHRAGATAARPAVKPPPGASRHCIGVRPRRVRRRPASTARRADREGRAAPPSCRPDRSRRPGTAPACRAGRAASAARRADPARVVVGPPRREPEHVVVRTRPRRPRPGREQRLDRLDDVAHRVGLERRVDERKLNARCSSSSSPWNSTRVASSSTGVSPISTRGGSYESAIARQRRMTSCTSGPVRVVDRALPEELRIQRIVGGRGRVVAQLGVLDDEVAHVDAEPGDAAVEPEPQDVVELLRAPPRSTS